LINGAPAAIRSKNYVPSYRYAIIYVAEYKSILPKLNRTQAAKVRSDFIAREKAKDKAQNSSAYENGSESDIDDYKPSPDTPLNTAWITSYSSATLSFPDEITV
jgi:hypothetical protein